MTRFNLKCKDCKSDNIETIPSIKDAENNIFKIVYVCHNCGSFETVTIKK